MDLKSTAITVYADHAIDRLSHEDLDTKKKSNSTPYTL